MAIRSDRGTPVRSGFMEHLANADWVSRRPAYTRYPVRSGPVRSGQNPDPVATLVLRRHEPLVILVDAVDDCHGERDAAAIFGRKAFSATARESQRRRVLLTCRLKTSPCYYTPGKPWPAFYPDSIDARISQQIFVGDIFQRQGGGGRRSCIAR